MDLWAAILLGLVEGITEYLPISSTGHLIITSSLLGLDSPEDVKASTDAFIIVIQGGAILAVAGLYWSRIVQMLKGLVGRDAAGRHLMINLLIAFLPAAVLGLLLHDVIEANLFSTFPVLIALFLGGVWMIWLDRHRKKRTDSQGVQTESHLEAGAPQEPRETGEVSIENLTWRGALLIGLYQVVAMWPGTSRSMMTIAGGTSIGLRPKEAAEFSFLLGLPTLGGACVYSLGKNVLEARESGGQAFYEVLGLMPVFIGIGVATLSAALAVKWLVSFLTRHGLSIFGWYRIALCAVLGVLIFTGLVEIG